MSLILEALKKSEARRQLGEAPGLGTPFTVTRRRRSPLPVILILIVAAGAFGWYYLGNAPPSGPDSTAKTAAAVDAKRGSGAAAPAKAAADSSVAARQSPAAAAQRAGTANAPHDTAQNAAVASNPDLLHASHNPVPSKPGVVASGSGTPKAEATPQQPTAPVAKPTVVASGAGAPKTDTQPAPTPAPPGAKPTMASATPPPMVTAAPQPAAIPPQPAAVTNTPAATPTPAAAAPAPPPSPPVPMYYELPFAVRKDLPPMNVSMHVYATNPTQRFVVVDGERKGEGDSLKDGLTLREIRNDGIVLEFRGQVFFYPRPGR